jgi:hypothetical protein
MLLFDFVYPQLTGPSVPLRWRPPWRLSIPPTLSLPEVCRPPFEFPLPSALPNFGHELRTPACRYSRFLEGPPLPRLSTTSSDLTALGSSIVHPSPPLGLPVNSWSVFCPYIHPCEATVPVRKVTTVTQGQNVVKTALRNA